MSVFLVLALVSQLVLWCVIAWSRVRLSVGYWLSCCVLDFPLIVVIIIIIMIIIIIIIIIIITKDGCHYV